MIKATFVLAFFAIIAVASAAPVADIALDTDEAGVMVNSATNPCERDLKEFARLISDENTRCTHSALDAAAYVGMCTVAAVNKFDGKTVNTATAFEDCSHVLVNHQAWCARHEPDSNAAKADLSNYSCPTRYQTTSGNTKFPKKGCDNIALDKLRARFTKSCGSGSFAGATLDALCNNKKCISAIESLHECSMDRFASAHSVCALLENTYSFSVFCPEDTRGYKAFAELDCEVKNAWESDKDFKRVREPPAASGSASSGSASSGSA
ncbi:hypothetical protein H696_05689 [Fonticula alba]|uniref:Uncharacterized protein n=1 Tax=Fonticula alba TaxID=691883 RepID=A0A058Z0T3_FONAL|nr:hypothetical protein H696_05689 [Fonticula alba]KCV67751.1 hypothetical protein H696_05689 [Fonticula alba]|eukprot:XP_009497782.1 hypothetical protein H696_05689 [Fonticula alba]